MIRLLQQAKKLPLSPGVYLFKDRKGGVLYVGKAASLRRRVASYFAKKTDSRVAEMVASANKIDFIKTDSVLEALILEANLIKKYWPKYNVKDRDDRSFIYVAISKKDDFPKPIIIRGRELAGLPAGKALIFGPYQALYLVKTALKIIRRIFPYSTCKAGQGKPCFDYQIGLCPGACVNKISTADYQKNIDDLILFLKGEKKRLLQKLKKENPEKILALRHVQDVALIQKSDIENFKLKIKNFSRIEGYDVSHLTGKETYGSMVVFSGGQADKKEYRLFKIKEAPANDDLRALAEVVVRRFGHREWPWPELILIDGGRPQISYLSKILTDRRISIPLIGISKFGGDRLIFSAKIKQNQRALIESAKPVLLRVREEAHRFALKASRHKRAKIV